MVMLPNPIVPLGPEISKDKVVVLVRADDFSFRFVICEAVMFPLNCSTVCLPSKPVT